MQNNRARIFMPFDALKGLQEALKRAEKLHDNKYIKNENIEDELKVININDKVYVKYFYNFEYINLIGQVKKIDYKNKYIIVSNSKIEFDDLDVIKKKLI